MSNHKFRDVGAQLDETQDSVEDRLSRLRAEADDITKEIGEDASEFPDDIRNSLDDIEDRIAELYDIVSAQAVHSAEVVEEIIETRPWISVAVAFTLGCAATLLLTPPRRPKRNWYGW